MNSSVNKLVKQGQDFADTATDQAQSIGTRGLSAMNDAAQQALETAADATDSLIAYTKKNPAKALLIAAASGALLLTLVKVLSPSRS